MLIEMEENNISINDVIIGIYNGDLSKSGKYKALIGLDLLEHAENVGAESISARADIESSPTK